MLTWPLKRSRPYTATELANLSSCWSKEVEDYFKSHCNHFKTVKVFETKTVLTSLIAMMLLAIPVKAEGATSTPA